MGRARTGVSKGPTIGVVIPFHGPSTQSYFLLRRCINFLNRQASFPEQILISVERSIPQESIDDLKAYLSDLDVRIDIVENIFEPGIAQNCNFASSQLQTDYIHLLFYDDYLVDTNFYKKLQSRLSESSPKWAVVSSWSDSQIAHRANALLEPRINQYLGIGINTLGPPTSLILKKDCWHNLNEDFTLFVDCVWYEKLIQLHGIPQIMSDMWIGITTWSGQTQNTMSRHAVMSEYKLLFLSNRIWNSRSVWSGFLELRRRGSSNQANSLLLGWLMAKLKLLVNWSV
jgi:hypothetical protein